MNQKLMFISRYRNIIIIHSQTQINIQGALYFTSGNTDGGGDENNNSQNKLMRS